jgi:cell wall-associated NlpC family hydrolase
MMNWVAGALMLIGQMQGTPYIPGGDNPAGTDCSGIVSWVANLAAGRPAFGNRFTTFNEHDQLAQRGFVDGDQPGTLVIGFNQYHTAITLPDGTPVASGETGGVNIGGLGAYNPQFTQHMFLPLEDLM